MPFVQCNYNPLNNVSEKSLSDAITSVISTVLGKPIDYICVNVTKSVNLSFAGTSEPSAMIQVSRQNYLLFKQEYSYIE